MGNSPKNIALMCASGTLASTQEIGAMDAEDGLPRKKADALAQLIREDLDRLSVAELDERIMLLETEAARCKAKRDGAAKFRSAADALFKK
jgi:uncharacterized small protein (DUF1192 family)